MEARRRGRKDFVKFKIRAHYRQPRREIWEGGYDSVGTRGREALLEEMSFQPVVEDNSDVSLEVSHRLFSKVTHAFCITVKKYQVTFLFEMYGHYPGTEMFIFLSSPAGHGSLY